MKILAVCGSPRKGNTELMLSELLLGASSAGAETELILLRKLKISHCVGCLSCSKTGKCSIIDDMKGLYPKIKQSDVLVLGSPNYYENVTGIMKDFIDRLNIYYDKKELKGKKVFLLCAGGSSSVKALDKMEDTVRMQGMEVAGMIGAKALEPSEIARDSAKLKECFEAGRELAVLKNKRGK